MREQLESKTKELQEYKKLHKIVVRGVDAPDMTMEEMSAVGSAWLFSREFRTQNCFKYFFCLLWVNMTCNYLTRLLYIQLHFLDAQHTDLIMYDSDNPRRTKNRQTFANHSVWNFYEWHKRILFKTKFSEDFEYNVSPGNSHEDGSRGWSFLIWLRYSSSNCQSSSSKTL